MAEPSDIETRRQWVLNAVERFEKVLLRYAQRLTDGDWDRTREAVQHTFLKLCQQNPESIRENLAGWLCTVCRHKIFDDARSASRQPPVDGAMLDGRASNTDGPVRNAERAELRRLFDQRIERLPPAQRSAIELWRSGASYPEIAELLGKDPTSIRVAVHRAITSLKADPAIANWLFDERPNWKADKSNGRAIPARRDCRAV